MPSSLRALGLGCIVRPSDTCGAWVMASMCACIHIIRGIIAERPDCMLYTNFHRISLAAVEHSPATQAPGGVKHCKTCENCENRGNRLWKLLKNKRELWKP